MDLYRIDYNLFSSVAKNCMKILPTGGIKTNQKIVVGDQDGVIHIFTLKKGEIQVIFKSLPGMQITNVILGGSIGTVQDKIFVTSNTNVRGFTKKGKLFLNFDSQLLDPIERIYVCGNDLILSAQHNYHHYSDCKLVDAYTCRDVINDLIALNIAKVRRLTTILACGDQMLRTLDGSEVTQSFELPNNPSFLYLMNGDGGTTGDHVLVGMQEGQVYLLQITSSSTIIKWILENPTNKSLIVSITMFDLLRSGIPEILIARHDGNVEVYTVISGDEVNNEYKPPTKKFSYATNGSVISSIQGGYVENTNFEQILIITHSGLLFGLTTEVPNKQLSNNQNDLQYAFSKEEESRIYKLKEEIEELELKIGKEKQRYLQQTSELGDSGGLIGLPTISIRHKEFFLRDDSLYKIILECETSIDNILIQCDIPIQILDSDNNHSVVSHSKCEPNSGNTVLIIHRCHADTTRFELQYFVNEGVNGTLQIYITPQSEPSFCQLMKFTIKPLCMHVRVHKFDDRVFHCIVMKGTFSAAEMHLWITQCLPDLPEKPPDEESVTYTFKSALVDTVLEIIYLRGKVTLKSDNISVIGILKDIISKEATKKKIKLEISTDINEKCIISMLRFLDEKLIKQVQLHKDAAFLEALKDIDSAQTESIESCLIPEFNAILSNEQVILKQMKEENFVLDRLQSVIINLFQDWHKFKGINVKPKMTSFTNTLKNNYSYSNVIDYFQL